MNVVAVIEAEVGGMESVLKPPSDLVLKRKLVTYRRLPVIISNCLVEATQAGNVSAVKLLLENGADVNALLVYDEFVLVGTERVCVQYN